MGGRQKRRGRIRSAAALVACAFALSLAGCAQQSDLVRQEKELSAKIAKLEQAIGETRAHFNQEMTTLREDELPQLRGNMDKGSNRFETVQRRLDDVENKTAARLNVIEKIQHDQANLIKAHRDRTQEELAKLAETVGLLAKTVEAKLDAHDKTITAQSGQLTQLNRSLTDLSAKMDADNKLTSAHLAEVNKSVSSVAKALRTVGEAIETREAEQDRRLDEMAGALQGISAQAGSVKEGKPAKEGKRGASRSTGPAGAGQGKTAAPSTAVAVVPAPIPVEKPAADGEQKAYEQSLLAYRNGDYEGARKGFSDFLRHHPDSKLAGNAQYWLGECYYGSKEYGQAIEAFDRVHESYPTSAKAPAALLKKGLTYAALNDRGRASSTLKQVVEAYPKSPEATKAKEKLAQLQ